MKQTEDLTSTYQVLQTRKSDWTGKSQSNEIMVKKTTPQQNQNSVSVTELSRYLFPFLVTQPLPASKEGSKTLPIRREGFVGNKKSQSDEILVKTKEHDNKTKTA